MKLRSITKLPPLAVATILTLSACGGSDYDSTPRDPTAVLQDKVQNIVVIYAEKQGVSTISSATSRVPTG